MCCLGSEPANGFISSSAHYKQFVIVEKPKTSHSRRSVTIPPSTVTALREWRSRQLEERMKLGPDWSDWGLVFTTQLGTPIHRRNVKRTLDRLLAKAKLAHQRIHDLRHAYATLTMAPARI